jgi:hypothetical protein
VWRFILKAVKGGNAAEDYLAGKLRITVYFAALRQR